MYKYLRAYVPEYLRILILDNPNYRMCVCLSANIVKLNRVACDRT